MGRISCNNPNKSEYVEIHFSFILGFLLADIFTQGVCIFHQYNLSKYTENYTCGPHKLVGFDVFWGYMSLYCYFSIPNFWNHSGETWARTRDHLLCKPGDFKPLNHWSLIHNRKVSTYTVNGKDNVLLTWQFSLKTKIAFGKLKAVYSRLPPTWSTEEYKWASNSAPMKSFNCNDIEKFRRSQTSISYLTLFTKF